VRAGCERLVSTLPGAVSGKPADGQCALPAVPTKPGAAIPDPTHRRLARGGLRGYQPQGLVGVVGQGFDQVGASRRPRPALLTAVQRAMWAHPTAKAALISFVEASLYQRGGHRFDAVNVVLALTCSRRITGGIYRFS